MGKLLHLQMDKKNEGGYSNHVVRFREKLILALAQSIHFRNDLRINSVHVNGIVFALLVSLRFTHGTRMQPIIT